MEKEERISNLIHFRELKERWSLKSDLHIIECLRDGLQPYSEVGDPIPCIPFMTDPVKDLQGFLCQQAKSDVKHTWNHFKWPHEMDSEEKKILYGAKQNAHVNFMRKIVKHFYFKLDEVREFERKKRAAKQILHGQETEKEKPKSKPLFPLGDSSWSLLTITMYEKGGAYKATFALKGGKLKTFPFSKIGLCYSKNPKKINRIGAALIAYGASWDVTKQTRLTPDILGNPKRESFRRLISDMRKTFEKLTGSEEDPFEDDGNYEDGYQLKAHVSTKLSGRQYLD